MASEEEVGAFVWDGVFSSALVTSACAVFDEDAGPVLEVVFVVDRKDTVGSGYSLSVIFGASKISFTSLQTGLKSL